MSRLFTVVYYCGHMKVATRCIKSFSCCRDTPIFLLGTAPCPSIKIRANLTTTEWCLKCSKNQRIPMCIKSYDHSNIILSTSSKYSRHCSPLALVVRCRMQLDHNRTWLEEAPVSAVVLCGVGGACSCCPHPHSLTLPCTFATLEMCRRVCRWTAH